MLTLNFHTRFYPLCTIAIVYRFLLYSTSADIVMFGYIVNVNDIALDHDVN